MSTFNFFSGGIAILSGIAYIFQSWRSLYITSSIPSILFVAIILHFLSESPRWCLIRRKMNQVMKTMHRIAITNGNHLSDGTLLVLDEEGNCVPDKVHGESKTEFESQSAITGSLIDVLHLPLIQIRLLLAVAINFVCSVVYYGLSLNVGNLGTNLYLNVLLNSIVEVPAILLTAILLNKFGRKPLAIGIQWFNGVFCIVGSLLKGYGTWKVVRIVCGIQGIFGMAGTYNLLFVYMVELFPTVVRNAALGCATQAAQMGAILSPFVVVIGEGIPFVLSELVGLQEEFYYFT
ncbi:unnamed protein product [Fraxinus pennsylvanica]|uniref:Major facilitator superfamily (MFS) profile domain-containing protein n=1 Tax=Fraxinus pennsylvanica TaxID=56036 RepID=A0AAD2DM61_9LAMI|nr:unnamed protein product [Fraxinus pennsylvanica]